jgi:hypothetical protein
MSDNNGKKYRGPVLSISISRIDDEKKQRAILDAMNDAFVGDDDYVNSNIIVSDEDDGSTITVCLNDIKGQENIWSLRDDLMDAVGAVWDEFYEEPTRPSILITKED